MIAKPTLRGARALLLSAYDAPSHRHWRRMLTALFPDVEWQTLTLPPRHFRWRVRGNSLYWAFAERDRLTTGHDFLLATSMTDLSALRGFVPELASLPTAVYFHENQFDYPLSERQRDSAALQILNLYTALCADRLVFNSHYNYRTFLAGAQSLMDRMPDCVPDQVTDRLAPAEIIPVPLPDDLYDNDRPARGDILTIAWNHRWEYDKGPELLLALVRELIRRDLPFRLHLMGQQFRRWPAAFDTLADLLAEHCRRHGVEPGQFGYVDDPNQYRALLAQADVVLSTALHDFQGLSLLEGMALGCTPLAPDRLAYPEYLPEACLYAGDGDLQAQAAAAADRLAAWARQRERGAALPRAAADDYRAGRLSTHYRHLLEELLTVTPADRATPT